jgi:predicted RNA-binding protein (virulence factor B family)
MIRIGHYQQLIISRKGADGLYLSDSDNNEVLMPLAFVHSSHQIGQQINVYVHHDDQGNLTATEEKVYLTDGQYAYLEITEVTHDGAYCDYGASEELFIPNALMATPLQESDWAVVHMFYDKGRDVLVGATKTNLFLKNVADEHLVMGQEVDILVSAETDLGYNVIINNDYKGLIYIDDLHKPLKIGQRLTGYVKPIRKDGKIDITLSPVGAKSIDPNARKIMTLLKKRDGFLPYTDKTDPYIIREELGISKKLFKKAIGSLYKERAIMIKEDGIYRTSPK